MKIGMRTPRRRHDEPDPSVEVAKATAAESFFLPPDHGDEPRRDEWVFLAQGTPEDWETLVGYTEHMRFKADETVIRAGELDRSLYFVTDGRLDIMLPQPNGAERLVYESFERLATEHPKIAQNLLFELARVVSLRLRWATQALACGWQ